MVHLSLSISGKDIRAGVLDLKTWKIITSRGVLILIVPSDFSDDPLPKVTVRAFLVVVSVGTIGVIT